MFCQLDANQQSCRQTNHPFQILTSFVKTCHMQFQNILPRTNLSKTFLKMVAPTFTTIGPQTSFKGTYRWLLIGLEEMLHDGSNTEINEMIPYCVLAISESRVRQRWVKTNRKKTTFFPHHFLGPPSHPFFGGGHNLSDTNEMPDDKVNWRSSNAGSNNCTPSSEQTL